MRFAIIKNGIVKNVILADPETAPDGAVQSDTAAIGDLWDGSEFSRPVVIEKVVITKIQALSALSQSGRLHSFLAAIESLPEVTKMIWQATYELHSDSPLIAQVWAEIGGDPEELQTLFEHARGIVV